MSIQSPGNRARAFGRVALLTMVVAAPGWVGQAQADDFTRTENAAISGNNDDKLSNASVEDCKRACIAETDFFCRSFDYYKNERKCDLSSKTASDVGGLKRDYAGNPYDHYERSTGTAGILDRSPYVRDVLYAVRQMNGQQSEFFETDLEGFPSKYGDAIRSYDHIQGITMTASGSLVISYSRQDPSQQPCKGMLAYSSPFDPRNPGKKLTWNYYCDQANGPEGHPSNIQATGDVVAVGTHGGSRFYHIPPGGSSITYLSHLSLGGGRDASGVVYNHVDRRHYALNGSGTVVPGDVSTKVCRTSPGAVLTDPNTSFGDCKTISAWTSGQGSNLIMQEDGTMFLFSAFSANEEWAAGWEAYGIRCNTENAALGFGGYGLDVAFHDLVYLSTIDFERGRSELVYNAEISRTQRAESCVHNRPSFRFAGGVATLDGSNELIGLWSGRQNPPVRAMDDDLEIAFQRLAPAGAQKLAYSVAIDCDVKDIDDEGTGNTITATFKDRNGKVVGTGRAEGIDVAACKFTWVNIHAMTNAEAEFVTISTNGQDGFMIDRITLEKDGVDLHVYGANNDKGWCFSTDPGDGRSEAWKYAANGTCVKEHTWSYSGKAVSGNAYDQVASQSTEYYSVRIDCHVDGADNEDTDNTITATFYSENGQVIGSGSVSEIPDHIWGCKGKDTEISAVTAGKAHSVKVSTNGSNGLLIDQIELKRNGEIVRVSGVDNDKGWCLSTDPKDANKDWSRHTDGPCQRSIEWKY